jgi:WD40 repeat protein
MGGKRTVRVGQPADDSVASLDGSTLYVSVRGSIVVLDVATGQIVRTVPAIGQEYFRLLSLSPDGRTLAAGTTYSSFVYLFDTATLTAKRVLITDPNLPTHPDAVSFIDSGQVVVWNGESDRMYAIDVATATQMPGVMNNIVNDNTGGSVRPSCSAAQHRAYVTQGPWWLGNLDMESDLAVVDVPTLMGSVRGKFAGFWNPTCLNPRDGKTLYIGAQGVDVDHPGMRRITIDAYDTQADSFASVVYTFRNQRSGGSDFSIRTFKIAD